MQQTSDNLQLFDQTWDAWTDMKEFGPASRWLRTMVRDILTRNVPPDAIANVLDFGCGEGRLSLELARLFPKAEVLGTDFSKTGIEAARRSFPQANLRFECDQASACLATAYDLVTTFEVLEHIEDWKPVAAGLAKAARKYLLVSVPTGRMRPFETAMGHYRNFRKGEIDAFFTASGFKVKERFQAGFPFYSPFYRELCNAFKIGTGPIGKGTYSARTKFVCDVIYFLFNSLSTRRVLGDQLCILFERSA